VVMKEYCTEADGDVLIEKAAYPGQHIRRAGGEFPRGRQVLTAGTRVTPPVVGLLATCGCSTVAVYRKPKVAIIITGDELTAPGKKLRRGRTYDANSYSLTSALHDLGIRESRVLHAEDTMRSLRAALVRAIRSADVVIPVGGVSVGEHDLVKEVLEKLGVKTVFWRAAIKPGKPNYFGIYHTPSRGKSAGRPKSTTAKKLIFGLPGNSVSALVSYHQLVRPALLKIMGYECTGRSILHATLQVNCRKNDNRLEWVRGRLTTKGGTVLVRPTTGQDSHMIGGLAQANCLIRFPRGKSELRKGEQVAVEPLNWRS
jgi:molybdopterin molybdotransferase